MGLVSNAMAWFGGKPWPRSARQSKPIVDWRPGIERSIGGQINGNVSPNGNASVNGYANGDRPHPADPRILPPSNQHRQSAYDSDLASMSMTRTYDAAVPTQGTADWLAWSTSGSFEVLYAWRRICYLARDLERNNPHARAFLRELCLNVIGANGIRLQPRVKNLKGKNLNDKLNEQILDGWTDFRAKGVYDVTGQYSGILADNMALRAMARDGGCLFKLHRGFKGNKYRFAVQLLEVDALDLWFNKILDNENLVTEGVEMDAVGKPVAYHLLKYSEADLMANNTIGQRVRVPAKDMLHVWLPERITSVRGVSWFASVLLKLRMLDKFEEAAAIAKRTTAAKMGFYEREKDAQHYTGQGQTETGEIIEEVSPGTMIELPAGVSFKPFDPGKTEDNYHDFRKAIMRTISGGLGVMYNSLANDLESVNYSTARFGRDLEVMNWRYLQTFWIDTVLQPIFNAWLEMAALAGEIPVTFEQMETVQKSMFWRPRGFPYIDPQKDVEAGTGAICFGLSTHSRELAEQGLDRDEVFAELAADKEAAEKFKLTFIDPRGRNPFISTQEDPTRVPGDTAPDAKDVAPASEPKEPVEGPPAPKKTTPTTVTNPASKKTRRKPKEEATSGDA